MIARSRVIVNAADDDFREREEDLLDGSGARYEGIAPLHEGVKHKAEVGKHGPRVLISLVVKWASSKKHSFTPSVACRLCHEQGRGQGSSKGVFWINL